MLLNANTGMRAEIPHRHQEELSTISTRMLPSEWKAMRERIKQWASNTGFEKTDFFASNWKTSKDWQQVENGIFQPLYSACNENFEYAGHMFGWLVRSVMIEVAKSEEWVMYKNPEAGSPELSRAFWGTFYWRSTRG